jgi:hypothetical protein
MSGDGDYLYIQSRASAGLFEKDGHVGSIKGCNAVVQIDSSNGFSGIYVIIPRRGPLVRIKYLPD